jgi:hypothetical protein
MLEQAGKKDFLRIPGVAIPKHPDQSNSGLEPVIQSRTMLGG